MAQGKLGKFGKVLETTPAGVQQELSFLQNGGKETPATPVTPTPCIVKAEPISDGAAAMSTDEEVDSKKKKKKDKKKKKKHKEQLSEVRMCHWEKSGGSSCDNFQCTTSRSVIHGIVTFGGGGGYFVLCKHSYIL